MSKNLDRATLADVKITGEQYSGNPRFSIIMPTYNRANVISQAITTLQKQIFTDFELIIVDDGSSDKTTEIIKQIRDPRLRYIYQENKGVSAARNTGVTLARGQIIAFLDSDDEALPGWLDAFANSFKQPQVGVVFVGCKVVEQDGQLRKFDILPQNLGPLFNNQTARLQAGTFAMRREVFEAVGGYVEGLVFGENTELVIRLTAYCKQAGYRVVSVAQPLILYHKHRFDGARAHAHYKTRLESLEYILTRHADKFGADPGARGLFLTQAGVMAARIGAYGRARRYFIAAIVAHPRNWKHYARLFIVFIPRLRRKFWLRHSNGII